MGNHFLNWEAFTKLGKVSQQGGEGSDKIHKVPMFHLGNYSKYGVKNFHKLSKFIKKRLKKETKARSATGALTHVTDSEGKVLRPHEK